MNPSLFSILNLITTLIALHAYDVSINSGLYKYLRLLGSLRGSLDTYGLMQKFCLKKNTFLCMHSLIQGMTVKICALGHVDEAVSGGKIPCRKGCEVSEDSCEADMTCTFQFVNTFIHFVKCVTKPDYYYCMQVILTRPTNIFLNTTN